MDSSIVEEWRGIPENLVGIINDGDGRCLEEE